MAVSNRTRMARPRGSSASARSMNNPDRRQRDQQRVSCDTSSRVAGIIDETKVNL